MERSYEILFSGSKQQGTGIVCVDEMSLVCCEGGEADIWRHGEGFGSGMFPPVGFLLRDRLTTLLYTEFRLMRWSCGLLKKDLLRYISMLTHECLV